MISESGINKSANYRQMKLSEIGEFGFIDRFAHKFENLLASGNTGIGDDCALIPCDSKFDLVITTDMLVEDIHFLRDLISPFDLGCKSLAVNLSDIAAMGAVPSGSFLSLAIPDEITVEYLDKLMDGYYHLSKKHGIPLMGGDTTRSSDKLVLNISAIGKVARGKAKMRSAAKSGDIIAVTGQLGNSAAGLKVLIENLPQDENTPFLVDCHNKPTAHIDEGIWLGKQKGVNAMMDVSDGIASDLKHILKSSGKGAEINLDSLPLSEKLKQFCSDNNLDAIELATSGGEDYCLLITIEGSKYKSIFEAYIAQFGTPLYPIGKINDETNTVRWYNKGVAVSNLKDGFNHFRNK